MAGGGAQNITVTVPRVNKRPGPSGSSSLGLDVAPLPPGGVAQFSVEVGVNKPWVSVVLHQAVDLPLSCHEDVGVRLVEALHDGVLGVEIQVYLRADRRRTSAGTQAGAVRTQREDRLRYLFGSFVLDKLLVNAAGPGEQVLLGGVRAELLAGRPKLDVLFAELRFEEDAEGGFSVCGRGNEEVQRQAAACLSVRGGIRRAPLQRARVIEVAPPPSLNA